MISIYNDQAITKLAIDVSDEITDLEQIWMLKGQNSFMSFNSAMQILQPVAITACDESNARLGKHYVSF